MNDQDLLDKYKSDFEKDYELGAEVRDKSNEEYRFITVPGGQWESFLESHYENRSKFDFAKGKADSGKKLGTRTNAFSNCDDS